MLLKVAFTSTPSSKDHSLGAPEMKKPLGDCPSLYTNGRTALADLPVVEIKRTENQGLTKGRLVVPKTTLFKIQLKKSGRSSALMLYSRLFSKLIGKEMLPWQMI